MVHRSPAVLFVAVLFAAGCARMDGPPNIVVDGARLEVTGPYSHENLSVFLIHCSEQDAREFITLDEGLETKVVKVSEGVQGSVQQLAIDNQSDFPLFLQEGDRIKGGKQDRTIYASLVVPPHSGAIPLPAFCIEAGRWQAGDKGENFANVENVALAPKQVRLAGKVNQNQDEVWAAVRATKASAQGAIQAPNTNSSLNETLDAPKVKELSDTFATALRGPLDANPSAIGVGIAVNGRIEEVNIYPNHQLLSKLYPRLLQSYALQAVTEKDKAIDAPQVTANQVVRFMTEGTLKSWETRQVDVRNVMQIRGLDTKAVECCTVYEGKVVHRQRLSDAARGQRAAAAANLENDEIGIDPSIQTNYNVDRIEDIQVPGPVNNDEKVGIVKDRPMTLPPPSGVGANGGRGNVPPQKP